MASPSISMGTLPESPPQGIAGRLANGQVVAISVPAPTERFTAERERIVGALRTAAKSSAWRR